MTRSERDANLSLIPTKRPSWMTPSRCIRTKPSLFARILRLFTK